MNALVPQLKARGVGAFVVLINEGGEPTCDYNKWPGISGPIVDIFEKFHRAVDIVVSGHTHRAYVCQIDGRLVTRGDKYRALVTATDVTLDSAARDIVSVKAENVIVANASLAMNTEQTALIEPYDKLVSPIANRPAGSVTQKLSCVPNDAGECARRRHRRCAVGPTKDAKDGGEVIAITNPGGIRTDIAPKENGAVSFGEVFASEEPGAEPKKSGNNH